jgi:hypothetical protein
VDGLFVVCRCVWSSFFEFWVDGVCVVSRCVGSWFFGVLDGWGVCVCSIGVIGFLSFGWMGVMCTRYVGVFLGKVLESHGICFLVDRKGRVAFGHQKGW